MMELTDDRILAVRKMWDGAHTAKAADIVAICDMALAHNAAKRQEPVAWWYRFALQQRCLFPDEKAYLEFKEAVEAGNIYAEVGEYYAAPPDLAAKLAEARELLEKSLNVAYGDLASENFIHEVEDFLARTK